LLAGPVKGHCVIPRGVKNLVSHEFPPLPTVFPWPALSPSRTSSISRYNFDVIVRKIH
jgi:hypothetical protein